LFVVDHLNDRVRVVGTDGIVTTIAGNGVLGSDLGDGGPATAASLFHPNYLAFAPDGSLYVTDRDNQRIRRIDLDGNINTVAGTGDIGFSGDGGPATEAELDLPGSLFIDQDGTVYFSDGGNNRIRKIDTNGVITTVAGTGKAGYSGDGGLATQAQLAGPQGVVVDAHGNLYIADYDNNVIRRIDTHGVITTVAGDGNASGRLHYNGPALRGYIRAPEVLTIGPDGRLFITEDDVVEPRLLAYDPTDQTLSTVAVLPVT
jgi:sugar lactone lactonase YvrE